MAYTQLTLIQGLEETTKKNGRAFRQLKRMGELFRQLKRMGACMGELRISIKGDELRTYKSEGPASKI